MDDLCVIVPSRGRPQNIARLVDAWEETHATADLLVVLDEDDPELEKYLGLPCQFSAMINQRQGVGMVGATNLAASYLANTYFALGFMGDDHVPRTVGWDQSYVETLKVLKTGFVYGNDLLQGQAMPTQVAMTSDIVRALGWMCPPTMKHLYVDIVWLELGRALDKIVYLPSVVVEHMHPAAGKAVFDERYAEVNDPETILAPDGAAFYAWKAGINEDVRKVRIQCGF